MEGHALLEQIHDGMRVHTSDGRTVGTIRHVWCGSEPRNTYTPCEDESCLEVHASFTDPALLLYIPCSVVRRVDRNTVILTMDAATLARQAWYHKAHWIPDLHGAPLITTMPKLW